MKNSTIYLLIAGLCVLFAIKQHEKTSQESDVMPAKRQVSITDQSVSLENTISKNKRTVTIKNDIEPKNLKYKHWTGTYTPSTFVLSVNGRVIERGQECEIDITDNAFDIRYDYDFSSYRKGAEVISFTTDAQTSELSLDFSWKDDYRVIVDNAIAQHKEKATFNA